MRSWAEAASANSTFVEGERIRGTVELHDGERVQFASVSMFFVERADDVPAFDPAALAGLTVRSTTNTATRPPSHACAPRFTLHEPSGGGGGMLVIAGKHVQLTLPMFELLSLLVSRGPQSGERRVRCSGLAAFGSRTIAMRQHSALAIDIARRTNRSDARNVTRSRSRRRGQRRSLLCSPVSRGEHESQHPPSLPCRCPARTR